jgi:hypothetical protein
MHQDTPGIRKLSDVLRSGRYELILELRYHNGRLNWVTLIRKLASSIEPELEWSLYREVNNRGHNKCEWLMNAQGDAQYPEEDAMRYSRELFGYNRVSVAVQCVVQV